MAKGDGPSAKKSYRERSQTQQAEWLAKVHKKVTDRLTEKYAKEIADLQEKGYTINIDPICAESPFSALPKDDIMKEADDQKSKEASGMTSSSFHSRTMEAILEERDRNQYKYLQARYKNKMSKAAIKEGLKEGIHCFATSLCFWKKEPSVRHQVKHDDD